MAFQITNPNWKSAARQKADQHAPAVAAWLAANPAIRFVGLAELKAALPGIAGDLNRTVVNQICVQLSLEVTGGDDQTV